MSQEKFKVIYTGKIKDGFEIDKVASQFAIKFKQTPEKAKAILLAKKEIVLNKQVEHVKAYKLKSVFEDLGMQVRLERVSIVITSQKIDQINNEEMGKSDVVNTTTSSSDSWTMEPIETIEPENEIQSDAPNEDTNGTQAITSNLNRIEKDTSVENNESYKSENIKINHDQDNIIVEFVKRFGGMMLGIGAFLFIAVKKFGLFKLLKIGVVVAASSVIGYNPEEACMSNSHCEDIVDDRMDHCWESNGFDDIDWDNITAEEYIAIQPKIEKDFIGCFKNEYGERVFVSPIELQFDLMDFCETSEIKNCNEVVEPQIKPCYMRNNLNKIFNDETTNYYETMYENEESIMKFYSCFEDEIGNKLFDSYYED